MAASSERAAADGALDLVLDIGKSRSKLLVLDRSGAVVSEASHASAICRGGAYDALDTDDLAEWLQQSLSALGPLRRHLVSAVTCAHGAAFAAVDDDRLCWPVPDYEFAGFDDRPADWARQIGAFDETQSPDLPRGLNAATQFDWLERHAGAAFGKGRLLPYAQFWSWWLSGRAVSEVSSLGCHTHLWNPARSVPSLLARRRGWAERLAPVAKAWAQLGPLRPALAKRLGLPAGMQVHVGVHDSNACLARYLRSHSSMTLVSTGTWIVVMVPGATERRLRAGEDVLCNVSVRQERVPTARFMGGRALQHLCAGADARLANAADLQRLLQRGVMVLPGFGTQGGPFRGDTGRLVDCNGPMRLDGLTPSERASLGALYAAQVSAWFIDRLGGQSPTVVEGPFSSNPVYTGVLASLLPSESLRLSADPLEGTARGAWLLAHWTEPVRHVPATSPALALAPHAVRALHARWCALADGRGPGIAGA